MAPFICADTPISEASLTLIAHLPTASLPVVVQPGFFERLTDADFMLLAVLLAEKSAAEGGCPIGGVVIDSQTRQIVGKGHNTLVQEGDPYNHGETAAMRDAGRIDFSRTTLFTTLSPCDVCATLLYMRGVGRVVVGDVTNASGNESLLRQRGVTVDVLESAKGIAQYAAYREQYPELDLEDWRGLAAVNQEKP